MVEVNSSHTFETFKYKSLNQLKSKLNNLNLALPLNSKTEILRREIKIDGKFIANRLAIQPMEGFDAKIDGSPSELTLRRYTRFARGGVSLIWFEATSIIPEGRSNAHQLVLSERNLDQFKKLASITKKICNQTLKSMGFQENCCLILQLNHSGRYSKRNGIPYPVRGYHNVELDKAINVNKEQGIIISDNELEQLENKWVEKAILVKNAGFDGVDIKSCHGYLISELLSGRMRLDSKYGGKDLAKRTKFLINIIKKLKKMMGYKSDFIITSRLGVYDGNPYPIGFGVKDTLNEKFPAPIDLKEPIALVKELYELGIKLINVSAGNPHYKPHITRPYDIPVEGGYLPKEHPLYSVYRMYHITSKIKEAIPKNIVIVGSAFSYLRQYAGNFAAGVVQEKRGDICGFGRMALANPEFAKQIFSKGMIDKSKTCITCSKCSEFMKLGKNTGCAVRDPLYQ